MQLFRALLHGQRHHAYGTPPEDEERAALLLHFLSTILSAAMSVFARLCAAAGVRVRVPGAPHMPEHSLQLPVPLLTPHSHPTPHAGIHFFTLVAARSAVLCALTLTMLWCRKINPFALNET